MHREKILEKSYRKYSESFFKFKNIQMLPTLFSEKSTAKKRFSAVSRKRLSNTGCFFSTNKKFIRVDIGENFQYLKFINIKS